jgi:trichoplein keratin filament-binding protein
MNLYRQYLADQAKEEERVERELDALITSEVAKQWAKRTEQWKREREARAKLMQQVIESRKQQIQEKCKLWQTPM